MTVSVWIVLAMMGSFAAGVISATLLRARPAGRTELGLNQATVTHATGHGETPTASPEPALVTAPAGGSVLPNLLAGQRIGAAAALGGIVVLAMVGLFASIEPPEPTTERTAARSEGAAAVERLAALTQQQPEIQQSAPQGGLATVDEMIERLASRLRQQPDDPEGWRMLGWSYFSTQRFSESAAAYLKAAELRPAFAEFRSLRGEALVSAAKGTVTPDAARAFDEALALDPAEPRARFFKGLAKAQAGDKASALDDWIVILNSADSNEPWQADLKQRVADLGREIGVDVSRRLRDRQAAASGDILQALGGPPRAPAPSQDRSGPSAEDVRAAEAMTPPDRSAMIRGMVDGLAARLEQSPHDVEGWIKLIRSRVVLGETDRARQALERALAIFDNAPQERSQIATAARELGILR